jgi:hypothetical protein
MGTGYKKPFSEPFFRFEIVEELGAHERGAVCVKGVAIGKVDGSDVIYGNGDFVLCFDALEGCTFHDAIYDVHGVIGGELFFTNVIGVCMGDELGEFFCCALFRRIVT